jgi:hypothetical protein
MADSRTVHGGGKTFVQILIEKREGKGPRERSYRCEDNIKNDPAPWNYTIYPCQNLLQLNDNMSQRTSDLT